MRILFLWLLAGIFVAVMSCTEKSILNQNSENDETKKIEVKKVIDTLTVEVTNLITVAKTLVAKAPRGKEGAAIVDIINTEVANFETAINQEIPAKLTAGNLRGTLDQLKAIKNELNAVVDELKSAYEKANRALPKKYY
jgi:hypothetical protein